MIPISHISKEIFKQKPLEFSGINPTVSAQMLVLSLGTGTAKEDQKYDAAMASRWGLLQWVYDFGRTTLLDIFRDASSDMVDFHVSTLFQCSGSHNNYLRIQVETSLIFIVNFLLAHRDSGGGFMLVQVDTLTGDVASVDISTTEDMEKLLEIGSNLLKEQVSKENLETGRFEKIEGAGTNEEALESFAKLLSEQRKLRLRQVH